ncbi:hypothetical protein [Terrarubrum flagellatum]|uniref:hypothetical protein n=1 Tax=Terrirubrum flagellatum TaxID=2895980 RepID=UPI003145541F
MITHKLPCHYVDFLCKPGLKTRGGTVSLQMYMGAHKNGQKSAEFLDALFGEKGLKDDDDPTWTPQWCVPNSGKWDSEFIIMRKGQGNHVYYVRLWDWIWDNQEKLGTAKSSVLRAVYDKYFVRKAGGSNPLQGMVNDAYFGNECIGFVSNYLRWIGKWESYKGADNHKWSMHFTKQINRLEDVRSLDLLEWVNFGHIALVDDVFGVIGGQLKLNVSQCSGFKDGPKGPMSNNGLMLIDQGDGLFKTVGAWPVDGTLNVRRMPDLQYGSPRYPCTPTVYPAAIR